MPELPGLAVGEWGWKIHFVDPLHGFIALEAYDFGAILVSNDGGTTWKRKEINDAQGNANLEGIGFVTPQKGWVGGWGDASFTGGFSSATEDGGNNWKDANEVGRFINRFRFIGDPVTVGYASGKTVYKYEPVPPPIPGLASEIPPRAPLKLLSSNEPEDSTWPYKLQITVSTGSSHLAILVWNRFGLHVNTLVDEENPTPGERSVLWGWI